MPSGILRPSGQANHGRTPAHWHTGTEGHSRRGREDCPPPGYARVVLWILLAWQGGVVWNGMVLVRVACHGMVGHVEVAGYGGKGWSGRRGEGSRKVEYDGEGCGMVRYDGRAVASVW